MSRISVYMICLFRISLQKELHEYCHFYETMVEGGWSRYDSAIDDTKRIGFRRNGKSIGFDKPKRIPRTEECYTFMPVPTSKFNSTTDIPTPTILPPVRSKHHQKQQQKKNKRKNHKLHQQQKQQTLSERLPFTPTTAISSTLTTPKLTIHTGSPLNGMPTGESQRHHRQHQHQHQQHQQHSHHHNTARKTPSIPKQHIQSINATNKHLMNHRATKSNSSALLRTNNKNSNRSSIRNRSNNNNSNYNHNSSDTLIGKALSNSNYYNISDRYGNRNSNNSSNSSGSSSNSYSDTDRINNSSIISDVNSNNHNNNDKINNHRHHHHQPQQENHYRNRHSHNKHQLPFHVPATSKNHNFQSDQSEQKPDTVQRNRNERKVVTAFHDNYHNVHRIHSNHRRSHSTHNFHYLQEIDKPSGVQQQTNRPMFAGSGMKMSSTPMPLVKKHFHTKKSILHKHLDGNSPKFSDPYHLHRHRHHHGENKSLKSAQYFEKTLPQYKHNLHRPLEQPFNP